MVKHPDDLHRHQQISLSAYKVHLGQCIFEV
jgi:hypothetical protein